MLSVIKKTISNKKIIGGIICCATIYYVYNYTFIFHKIMRKLNSECDPSYYENTVAKNYYTLPNVPWYALTSDICWSALRSSEYAIFYIPSRLITREMWKYAISRNPWFIQSAPKKILTQDICHMAMHRNPSVVMYVPKKFQTDEMWEHSIMRYPSTISHLPESKNNFRYINNILSTICDEFDICKYYLHGCIIRQQRDLESYFYTNGNIFKYLQDDMKVCTDTSNDVFEYLTTHDFLHDIPLHILQKLKTEFDNFYKLVLTGEQFNRYFSDLDIVKIISPSNIHNKFIFQEGLNDDSNNFDHRTLCDNGLYFTIPQFLDKWRSICKRGPDVYRIKNPSFTIIKFEGDKWKTSHFVRSTKYIE